MHVTVTAGLAQVPRALAEAPQDRVRPARFTVFPTADVPPFLPPFPAHSSLDMWYLHGPDRKTPYEETLRAVNELYKEGKFKRFGISNYYAYAVPSRYPTRLPAVLMEYV